MKKKLLILINCLLGIAPVYSWSMGRFVRFGTRAAQARSWSRAGGTWQRSSSVLSSTDKWRQRQSHWSSPSYKVPLLLGAAAALGAAQRVYAQEEECNAQKELQVNQLVERYEKIVQSSFNFNGYEQIRGVLAQYYPDLESELLRYFFELSDSKSGAKLLVEYMNYISEKDTAVNVVSRWFVNDNVARMVEHIQEQPLQFACTQYSYEIITILYEKQRFESFDLTKIDKQEIKQYIPQLLRTKLGRALLFMYHTRFSILNRTEERTLLNDLKKDNDLKKTVNDTRCAEQVLVFLAALWDKSEEYPDKLLDSTFDCFDQNRKADIQPFSSFPSIEHALKYRSSFKHFLYRHRVLENGGLDPFPHSFFQMVNKALVKEREIYKRGEYYTFFHGQQWHYAFFQSLYQMLYAAESHQQIPDDFLFVHQRRLECELNKECGVRESLLHDGFNDTQQYQPTLFMNYALGGNSKHLGSNTLSYIYKNNCVGIRSNVSKMRDIFGWFGHNELYEKYHDELTALQDRHDELSAYGQLLLVAVPKNQLSKCVYYTPGWGMKRRVTIKGVGKTDDITTIMETLHNNPNKFAEDPDTFEFVLTMTQDKDGGANPESGIKFFSFNTVDKEKYNEYKCVKKDLFARIKNDIELKKVKMEEL